MEPKAEIFQGTLTLMILKTLAVLGPTHGYGVARRIEEISGDAFSLNYGTVYPALLKLEQEGFVVSEWGVSDNNRKAKFYRLTAVGRRHLRQEVKTWKAYAAAVAKVLGATQPPLPKEIA